MGIKRIALAAVSGLHVYKFGFDLKITDISCEYISCVCSFNKSAIIKLETQSKIIASFTFHNNIKSHIFNTPRLRAATRLIGKVREKIHFKNYN